MHVWGEEVGVGGFCAGVAATLPRFDPLSNAMYGAMRNATRHITCPAAPTIMLGHETQKSAIRSALARTPISTWSEVVRSSKPPAASACCWACWASRACSP